MPTHLGEAGEAVALQQLGPLAAEPGGQRRRPQQRQHLPDPARARTPGLLHSVGMYSTNVTYASTTTMVSKGRLVAPARP